MSMKRRIMLTRPKYRGSSSAPVLGSSTTAHTHAHAHAPRSSSLRSRRESVAASASTAAHAHVHASTREGGEVALLVDRLLGLPKGEQKKVLDSLLAHQMLSNSTGSAKDRDLEMWAEAVHRAMVGAFGPEGGGSVGPGVIRKVVRGGTSWEHVTDFMRTSGLEDLKVNDRQRAYNLLAELVVDHARYVSRRSGAPLSPKLVVNCATNIAGVFENAFPGYLGAGLAQMVVRAEVV